MLHIADYRKDRITDDYHNYMTVCGLVVGQEFIWEPTLHDYSEPEDICPTCSQMKFRRDEPESEVGLPDVEGRPYVKQERYGD